MPPLHLFAFVLDPRVKMRILYNILELFGHCNNNNYNTYFDEIKTQLYKSRISMKPSLV
jgi:acyl-CoA thioesterase FadM